MALLLITVFVDFTCFGIIFPVLPFLTRELGGSAADVTLVIAAGAVAQAFCGPFWGRASDRFGRRPVLVLALVGSALSYLWFGFAGSLAVLYFARMLTGATKGAVPIAYAWAADLSPPEQRPKAMGRIGAAIALGFVAGPALGGLLAELPAGDQPHFALPCWVADGLSAANTLLALALAEPKRLSAVAGDRPAAVGLRESGVAPLLATLVCLTIGFSLFISILPMWAELRFGWGPGEVGWAFAGTGVIIAMVQGGLLARATRAIGETGTFLAGTALLAAGLLGERLVTDVEGFVVQAAVLCFGYSLCQPTVLSLISGRAPPERQGAAMGTAATAGSLGRIAGPLVAGVLFEQVGPSAPQTLAGLLIVVLLALAARSLAGRRRS